MRSTSVAPSPRRRPSERLPRRAPTSSTRDTREAIWGSECRADGESDAESRVYIFIHLLVYDVHVISISISIENAPTRSHIKTHNYEQYIQCFERVPPRPSSSYSAASPRFRAPRSSATCSRSPIYHAASSSTGNGCGSLARRCRPAGPTSRFAAGGRVNSSAYRHESKGEQVANIKCVRKQEQWERWTGGRMNECMNE